MVKFFVCILTSKDKIVISSIIVWDWKPLIKKLGVGSRLLISPTDKVSNGW